MCVIALYSFLLYSNIINQITKHLNVFTVFFNCIEIKTKNYGF